MMEPHLIIRRISPLPLVTLLITISFTTACKMSNLVEALPRDEELPLFDPHIKTFACAPAISPSFDAQAEAWFQESRTLVQPEMYTDDRDYKKIVAITRQAADRRNWKAMLNLASLIIEERDPPHTVEDAVQLVEEAMRMGVPAAYDRMGTYYMNGTGVKSDATRAYAFWQRAAQMGNPDALAYLGRKLYSANDHPENGMWANSNIGIKMLECAYSQGHGPAAYQLAFLYSIPIDHKPERDELNRAVAAWHNGVKFGSAECAAALSGEFRSNDADRMVLHPDTARSERYWILARTLKSHPDHRFPNLDMILPLPPTDLPPWNGDGPTLIKAAIGVGHPAPVLPRTSAYLERKGRYYLAGDYLLTPTDIISGAGMAPFSGYWQPAIPEHLAYEGDTELLAKPALYQKGEHFDLKLAENRGLRFNPSDGLIWRHLYTVRHDDETRLFPVVSGGTRVTEPPAIARACSGSARCPISGVWQPRMHTEHPMHNLVNQYWRQVWLVEGQRFPNPQQDWILNLEAGEITWHLMDSTGVDIGAA